jgi:hypothetical protein
MLRQLFYYFIGIIIIFSAIGCGDSNGEDNRNTNPNENQNIKEQISEKGFSYFHIVQNEGPKPQVGEYAYYNLEIYGVNDSLSKSTFLEGTSEYYKVLPIEVTKGLKNPIIDVLCIMAVGDSLIVKMSPKSIESMRPGYSDFSYINLQIKLTDIKTPEEHSKAQIEKSKKRKEKKSSRKLKPT